MNMLKQKVRAVSATLAERRRLRGPANLHYALADSISMLDRSVWQQVAGPMGFFMSVPYLQMLESSLPANISPRYALVFRDGEDGLQPIAAVYMQIVDVSLIQAAPPKVSEAAARLPAPMARMTAKASQRILACGNMLTYGQHGVAVVPDADSQLVWHGVAEVLYRVRQAEKLVGRTQFVMIKDLYDGHAAQAAYLKNLSYRYVETEPNMVLDLRPEWKGYDDYLASLSSKYRSGIRNAVFKPIEEAGCRVERLSVDEAVQAREELFALYKAVQSNASFRPFELNAAYFGRLLQTATSDHALCSVIRREDRLLGFLITIADGDTAIAYHIGFDRQEAAAFPLYLRLLHAGIEDAISFGCRRISYGRTALEPKASLGAKPQQFGVMVRHCQPVLNKLMKRMLTGIEHDDAPQRNPFKKAA
jgi:predicted N-acyltransferase